MAQIIEMKWQNTKSLEVLAKGVEKSVRASIGYLNSECPASKLKLLPTFITEPVVNDAKRILNSIYDTPYTMLAVEICNYGVKLSIICIRGNRDNDIILVGERDASEAFKYKHSAEKFFGFIANECFHFVKSWTKKELYIAGRTLLCTVIFRFDVEFTSLRDSKVVKFMRNFHVQGCEGKDISKILGEQFKIHQRMAIFRILCTNVTCNNYAITTGLCVQEKIPDLLVSNDRSTAFNMFENRHEIAGHVGEKMLIELHKFGEFIGSEDNILLKRFVIKSDSEYKYIDIDKSFLMDKLTSYYWICYAIQQFLHKENPELEEKFAWLKCPEAITVKDISNLLQSIEEKKELKSKLLEVYHFLNQDQRSDLVQICKEFTDRAAKMMAAFTYGIILTKDHEIRNKKVVVGLYGHMFSDMHGYKTLFKSTLEDLKKLDSKDDLKIEYIEASEKSKNFGICAISRYIGEYSKGKGFTLC